MTVKKKIFKDFLLSKNSSFISHAISKIHLTNDIYSKNENYNPILSFIKKLFYILDNKSSIKENKKPTDILIVSNLVSLKKNEDDIYFGNLDNLLKKDKIKTITVYRNHTLLRSKSINKILKKKIILLSKRSEYLKEIYIFLYYLIELFLFVFSNKYLLIKKFLSIKDIFSIISNLRLYFQLEKLFKLYKPKVVIFTYEGHAWERLLIFLCNNNKNKIKSVAFQFSAIKKNQIGFFNKLKKEYNPDYIATTGKIPRNIIKKRISFSKIIKLGSPKYIKKCKDYSKNIDLLVALDTDKKNLFKTLNFCINFALNNFKFKIILRLHPITINNKSIVTNINKLIENISNIELSKNKLVDDLKKTRNLLYTDSTICLIGLNYNVEPLFFEIQNANNIFDNRFPVKNIIKNYSDLKNLLGNKKNKKLSKYFKNYRDNYFEKFELTDLKKIIKK